MELLAKMAETTSLVVIDRSAIAAFCLHHHDRLWPLVSVDPPALITQLERAR